MSRIVCNIPHSGREIPEWAWQDFIVAREEVEAFAERLCDIDVDKLFSFVAPENKVFSPLSRAVVDIERFKDDALEDMAKIGMGWFYLKDERGVLIRKDGKSKEICSEIYDRYHKELEKKVARVLENNGECWVLDCHSFPDDIEYTKYRSVDFPDVCIGYNDDVSCPPIIRERIKQLFENAGYSVKFNIPFAGCLIPLKYADDSRVKGVMLELNRRSYIGKEEKMSALCRQVCLLLDSGDVSGYN